MEPAPGRGAALALLALENPGVKVTLRRTEALVGRRAQGAALARGIAVPPTTHSTTRVQAGEEGTKSRGATLPMASLGRRGGRVPTATAPPLTRAWKEALRKLKARPEVPRRGDQDSMESVTGEAVEMALAIACPAVEVKAPRGGVAAAAEAGV